MRFWAGGFSGLESAPKSSSADGTIPRKVGAIRVERHNNCFLAAIGAGTMIDSDAVITGLGEDLPEFVSL